ncbi:MAG: AMP-binding protein [Rhizobiales bacterium]|nr:AMP-binding protein [Hyphomicrobiales bacterium]
MNDSASGNAPGPGAASTATMPWLAHYPASVEWKAPLAQHPMHELLEHAARRFPKNTCTNFLGATITYEDMLRHSDKAAKGLAAAGVTRGTKVGLFLPNSPTFIAYYYAILKLGAVVVNYNPLYTVEELAYQVKDSETEIMVTLDLAVLFGKVAELIETGALKRAVIAHFPALLPGLKSALFKLLKSKDLARPRTSAVADRLLFDDALTDNDGKLSPVAIDPANDIAVLQYTGGTTGTPKGAMLTHANLSANISQMTHWAPDLVDGKEKVFGALPFFHVFAMTTVMNFGIARAAEIVMMPRFMLDDGLKLIAKTRPSIMPGVPTLYNALMNHPKIKNYDLSSLKMCISGGAPLPIEVKRGFEAMTGCKLVEGYGLSETSPVATCNPIGGIVKEGSIGQPVPGTKITIREIGNSANILAIGEKGEICIEGPQVMKGYWKRPDETADVMVGAALRTGDVGYMDEQGFTFIVDRLKDLIICSGYNVYPRRVEEAIYEFPAVEEVTVIGIPDDYRGEAPKAFIKLRKGKTATTEEILKFLEKKLSKIEMPAEIEFRDELPKTMIGKLSKKELKQEEAGRRTRS